MHLCFYLLIFHTREEFYEYMKQFEGFRVPEANPKPVEQIEQIEKIEANEPIKGATRVNQEYSEHIQTFTHVSNNEVLYIGNLPNGIYFLKIIEGNTIKDAKLILCK